MAKPEPSSEEIKDFQDKQGKLYDNIEGFEREKEIAFEKNNPKIYEEAQSKIGETQKEIDANIADWDKKYGNDIEEKKDDNQQEQQHNPQQEQTQLEREEEQDVGK